MVVQKSTETRVVLDNDIATSKPLQFFFLYRNDVTLEKM